MNYFQKYTSKVPASSHLLKIYESVELCFKPMFLLGRVRLAQLVKISFIVFHVACLIFITKPFLSHSIALSLKPFICREFRVPEELGLSKFS